MKSDEIKIIGSTEQRPICIVQAGTQETSEKNATESPSSNSTIIEEFQIWLKERREKRYPYPVEHAWSHRKARKRFARSKDVDRYFSDNYSQFTTVLLTRTADKWNGDLIEQSKSLNPTVFKSKRYRLLNRLSNNYACVSCLAPKYDLPNSTSEVMSHVHEAYWIAGHHSKEVFQPLLDKHQDTVAGATSSHVSVQHHSTDSQLVPQSSTDEIRGATTSLPYELARNLPLINVDMDAIDLHDPRALEWCAVLSAGTDGCHSTGGIRCWQPFGQFNQYADSVRDGLKYKTIRDYRQTVRDDELNNPWLNSASMGTLNIL